MSRKSFWATLVVAALLACFASFYATPTVSASPAHAAHHSARMQYVGGCPTGFHLQIGLSVNGGNSVFGNYEPACVNYDSCATSGKSTYDPIICLYQDANYGGQEIEFWRNINGGNGGCANLTDFAGPGRNGTWNDAVSSFRIEPGTVAEGAFWWDTYDSGYYYLFGPPGSGRVSATTYIGNTWNDQMSSLQLDPNPGGC